MITVGSSFLLIFLYYLAIPLFNILFIFYYSLIFCVIYWNIFKKEEKWVNFFQFLLYQIILMLILLLVFGGIGALLFFIGKTIGSSLPDFLIKIYGVILVACFLAFFVYFFAVSLLLFFKTLSIRTSLKHLITTSKSHWKNCIFFTLKVTGVSILFKFLILSNLDYVPFFEWGQSTRMDANVLFLFGKDIGFCNQFLQSWAYAIAFFVFYEKYEKLITLPSDELPIQENEDL
jgi:hypothetical protein